MPLHVIDHPLIRHKLSILRENDTPCSTFRTISNEIGALLVYEACRDLPTEKYEAQGWAGPVTLERVAGKMLTIVPILRAGLGLMDGVVSMIPGAKVSVVGLFRDEKNAEARRILCQAGKRHSPPQGRHPRPYAGHGRIALRLHRTAQKERMHVYLQPPPRLRPRRHRTRSEGTSRRRHLYRGRR